MRAPRVRLSDVAQLAKTSTKTASRVVNGDPRVSQATRERVQQAVIELDYQPDPLARSLRSGTDDTIGVVVDEVSDPFFASVIGEIERMALDRDITVIVASTRRLAERERTVLDGLAHRRIAGLILSSVTEDHASLRSARYPIVFIDREATGLTADAVLVDDRAGARMAVEHLLSHGHRRIAYVGDRLGLATVRNRLAGYRDALAAAGVTAPDEYVVHMELDGQDGDHDAVGQLLALDPQPTAIFCANTRSSLRALPVMHRTDNTHIAFVSFGDFAMADTLAPAVSVVNHSPRLIGQLAAERLFRRLGGEDLAPERIFAPLEIVARGSGELTP
ncbi:LacI family DNA-binding transcriptional regulator [Streptomyces sp. NPDC058001]|uniref:LacI family DNA-binding transcriptional regulator n=1 Tax=Streptomyces sp. NPDC058001 TaxID=3346300 RepID=UPI0036ED1EE4